MSNLADRIRQEFLKFVTTRAAINVDSTSSFVAINVILILSILLDLPNSLVATSFQDWANFLLTIVFFFLHDDLS